jgi:hypothetical protein
VNETRLRIVSAGANETLKMLAKRTGNVWDDTTTAVVNGLTPDRVLKKGQLVKIAIPQQCFGNRYYSVGSPSRVSIFPG